MVFLDRSRRADHRLEWKVRAFTIAAVLGIAGIYFDARWMTGTAIVVLLGGLFLRIGGGARELDDPEDVEPGDEQKGE